MKIQLSKSNFLKTMNFKKIISSTVFASSISLFSALTIGPDKVKAQACPVPSGLADANEWVNTTGGSCNATPEEYGVTVYKMGFCSEDPGDGLVAGSAPLTNSCTFTYKNATGESKSFAVGGEASLSEAYTSTPDVGTYPYAVIELSPTFNVKGSYGPLADGNTYYSTDTHLETSTSLADHATTPAPMKTFYGPQGENICVAKGTASVTGGSISAFLLDSNGNLIANDSNVTECSGVSKLFGVMSLDTSVVITPETTGLTATFTVTDNGTTLYYDPPAQEGGEGSIGFDSGPFSVTFETVE